MISNTYLSGPNAGYILELYDLYKQSPDLVDPLTRQVFDAWTPRLDETNGNGHAPAADMSAVDVSAMVGAVSYAQAIRQYGHLGAHLNPLGFAPSGDPKLDVRAHGITDDALRSLPASLIGGPAAEGSANAYEAIQALHTIYSDSIGYETGHIHVADERMWLQDAIETRRYRFENKPEQARELLDRLIQIDVLENFLQKTFPTKYRFSVEGLDMMVPMLDVLVEQAQNDEVVEELVVAMAHRGRLNVMAHVLGKSYKKILADFIDPLEMQQAIDAVGWTIDDVKYHRGFTNERPGLKLYMPPNPSHLEAVNPVAIGMARALGTTADQRGPIQHDPHKTMQVLIHGDASFPGQGIVAETFNLSRLPGYSVGGTVHIIANNLLGFTTLPQDGRSTLYASDLAKGFNIPIIHVNADDPAACIEVIRLAFAYQSRFERDILIDLVGYRRYGHNELDEPGFTQPKLYETIRAHAPVRQLWAEHLIEQGIVSSDDVDAIMSKHETTLQEAYDSFDPEAQEIVPAQAEKPEPGRAKATDTSVNLDALIAINDGLTGTLEGFNFYSKRFEKTIRSRRLIFNEPEEPTLDWATAEELAFATILADGTPIRLTGQDTERGTFSHRHAVLHDAETGEALTPLQALPQAKAAFEVQNSPLSEQATLAFEFGYSVQKQDALVIWEAQYGDFINGAQNIVDEFIVSAREKWGQLPALVLLLPHGYEGAGPDHSSARLERFLSLATKTNMRIASCTTAAQYFHLLRRQALLLNDDRLPLVVMSPKSLLRSPNVYSPATEMAQSGWQPVIDDPQANPKKTTRLVFCSGKYYYDLVNSEWREKYPEVAIVRVEQLYPLPVNELTAIWERYRKTVKQVLWAQEEPKNMGAWDYMSYRLSKMIQDKPVHYMGRRRSPSPAEGSKTVWQYNQNTIIEYTFTWDFDHAKWDGV
ncbi:2-oxoglutarate dehydrogenase E1 component [Phototrophicus methaneseepsis]|uniref:oxoglutarate dehydrogenase (succinyl-transferring) n=1 Tax=Phototrophicus methaneseepsis TaxID=2710758 RepID=A0A7S8E6S3_9CHLR|nr:2-oxoglutarate dehydrogenase E1 component [Phototrophicus methaneseepsis]QPC81380.1 2-oxoglutarate dehydrogenase E1 component [Phototrophicus methaneseepsis]